MESHCCQDVLDWAQEQASGRDSRQRNRDRIEYSSRHAPDVSGKLREILLYLMRLQSLRIR